MTTPNMNLLLPTEGGSADIWDVLLDAAFTTIDAHNHSPGQGVLVPVTGLSFNANLQAASAGANFGIYDAAFFGFSPVAPATMAPFAGALFVSGIDSNLYYRTLSGANVQVTNGAALNFSAFVGGIGGDYSAVGALLSYDDATRRYLLQQEGSPRPWAGLATGPVDIYQKAASIVNKVTLQSPAALAASYALTLLTALPASLATLRVDNAGNVTAAAATETLQLPAPLVDLNSNARAVDPFGMYAFTLSGGAGNAGQSSWGIPLQVGDVITGFTVWVDKTTSAASTISATLRITDSTNGATFSSDTASLATNAPGFTTIPKTGLARAIATHFEAMLTVGMSAGAGVTDQVFHAEVTYQRLLA